MQSFVDTCIGSVIWRIELKMQKRSKKRKKKIKESKERRIILQQVISNAHLNKKGYNIHGYYITFWNA